MQALETIGSIEFAMKATQTGFGFREWVWRSRLSCKQKRSYTKNGIGSLTVWGRLPFAIEPRSGKQHRATTSVGVNAVVIEKSCKKYSYLSSLPPTGNGMTL
jgi:hypothetical protein